MYETNIIMELIPKRVKSESILPEEIWANILEYLPFASIYEFGQTNKFNRERLFLKHSIRILNAQVEKNVTKVLRRIARQSHGSIVQERFLAMNFQALRQFIPFYTRSYLTGSLLWSTLLGVDWDEDNQDIDIIGEVMPEVIENSLLPGARDPTVLKILSRSSSSKLQTKTKAFLSSSRVTPDVYFSSSILTDRSNFNHSVIKWYDYCACSLDRTICDFLVCLPGTLENRVSDFDLYGCMSTFDGKVLRVTFPQDTLRGRTRINRTYKEVAGLPNRSSHDRIKKYAKRGVKFISPPIHPESGLIPTCLKAENIAYD
jgi:hypothetical protein